MEQLELSDNERAVLAALLHEVLDYGGDPLSPRIEALKAILARLEPQKPQAIPEDASTG